MSDDKTNPVSEKPLSRVPRDVPPPPKPDPRIIPPAIKGQYPRKKNEAPTSKG